MDLTTRYLGFKLKNPLIASASPLSENVDKIKQLEEAGISAVVLHSLFEEQITRDVLELHHHLEAGTEGFAESLTYFPEPREFKLGPEEYLEHIQKAKRAVKIPIIASLNGASVGGWTGYARKIQEAGADALELNIYYLPTGTDRTGVEVEQTYLQIVQSVKLSIQIPVAVKLGPYFSSIANVAKKLDVLGVDGLVLFNRFYQPDIDLERLEVAPNVLLSTRFASRLPLRWVAILYGHVKAHLAATSGIHEYQDVLKMIMAGADATMLCSTLLKNGIPHVGKILKDMQHWMEEHDYGSIKMMQGSMSQKSVENPDAFERANYMKVLQSYKPDAPTPSGSISD
ncbi:MAG: dihydroorotate dehydrogenase-like protein [Elusimicrobia bacterium]|nr:dihydroorotate dehydrogenase-like protein [Candidatus Obscuribacterium magneticum]